MTQRRESYRMCNHEDSVGTTNSSCTVSSLPQGVVSRPEGGCESFSIREAPLYVPVRLRREGGRPEKGLGRPLRGGGPGNAPVRPCREASRASSPPPPQRSLASFFFSFFIDFPSLPRSSFPFLSLFLALPSTLRRLLSAHPPAFFSPSSSTFPSILSFPLFHYPYVQVSLPFPL